MGDSQELKLSPLGQTRRDTDRVSGSLSERPLQQREEPPTAHPSAMRCLRGRRQHLQVGCVNSSKPPAIVAS